VTLIVSVYGVVGEYMRRELLSLNTSCPVQASCNSNGVEGVCVSRSSGCCRGTFNSANLCPGNNDIQCCYYAPCQTNHGSGTCMQTSLCHSQGGTPDSGNYCDGPADLQCCVKGGPTPSGKVTRDEMIARAQDWVNRRIPYSQSAYTGTRSIATVLSYISNILSAHHGTLPYILKQMDIARTARAWFRWPGSPALLEADTPHTTCR